MDQRLHKAFSAFFTTGPFDGKAAVRPNDGLLFDGCREVYFNGKLYEGTVVWADDRIADIQLARPAHESPQRLQVTFESLQHPFVRIGSKAGIIVPSDTSACPVLMTIFGDEPVATHCNIKVSTPRNTLG